MMHDKLFKTQYSWEISTQWIHRVHSALIGVNISNFRSFQWFTKIIFLNFNDQQSCISYSDLSLGEFVHHLNRFSKHGDLLRMLSNNSCIKLQTHVSRSSNSNKKSTKTSSLVCWTSTDYIIFCIDISNISKIWEERIVFALNDMHVCFCFLWFFILLQKKITSFLHWQVSAGLQHICSWDSRITVRNHVSLKLRNGSDLVDTLG